MEYVGFIISLLALFYLFFKQQSDDGSKQEHPDENTNEELTDEEDREAYMRRKKALKEEPIKQDVPSQHLPPPPQVVNWSQKLRSLSTSEKWQSRNSIEENRLRSSLEDRYLKSKQRMNTSDVCSISFSRSLRQNDELDRVIKPPRAEMAIRRLSSRRDLIIYQEIIDKPKSMRPLR